MIVSTLAGTGEMGHRDGEGAVAQFSMPSSVAVDGDGSIIVADTRNHRIRKITSQGQGSTLAGTSEKGHQDGEGTSSTIVSARSHHRVTCPLWRAMV
jgi:hypothetical protein